jgi:hypothetical protein
VNCRNHQIASRQSGKLLLPIVAARAECRQCVHSLVIALFLVVLASKVPVDASDAPSGSASKVAKSTDATGNQLLGVHLYNQSNYSQLVIDLSADVQSKIGHLTNPERVYLDFPQTAVNPSLIHRSIAIRNGLIDQVRIGTSQGPVTRVVVDLATPVRYRVTKVDNPTRMLV